MVNYNKLNDAIADSKVKSAVFEKALGLTRQAFWKIRYGKTNLTVKQATIISEILGLTPAEAMAIFFAN